MTEDDQRKIDGLGDAISRVDRERQERDEYVNRRFEELERHADWLHTRVGQIFFWLAVVAVGYVVKDWIGHPLVTAVVAFSAGIVFSVLFMGDGKKGPILWRHVRHLPHLRKPGDPDPSHREASG